jgi:hypothetical protein
VRAVDFTEESDHIMYISEVLLHLKTYLEEHPVRYPAAMLVYTTLFYGVVPKVRVNCPHDSECEVTMKEPVGGLCETFEAIDECLELIDLEMDYEAPSFVYPADYSI